MRAVSARLAIRAKPGQVEGTDTVLAYVLVCAIRSEGAKATFVVRAGRPFQVAVEMQVQTIIRVFRAGSISSPVGALGHAAYIVLMQVLTRIAFLAEAADPVLAYETVGWASQ